MSRFLELLHSGRILLMDGAMGTELQRAGLPPAMCCEFWNLTQPERVRAIHQAYIDAGAQCLLTNSFQANPPALARHHQEDQLEAINRAAIALARSVAGPDHLVVADMGPMPADVAAEEVNRTVRSLRAADALLLETCSDLHLVEMVRRIVPPQPWPVLLSLTYQRTPTGELRTHAGERPEECARRAAGFAIAALGVNCGRDIGLAEIVEIIRRYRRQTDLPLFARPNAGTPTRSGDRCLYPGDPTMMAAYVPELIGAGVSMIGGCCGTTPEHIAAFRSALTGAAARS